MKKQIVCFFLFFWIISGFSQSNSVVFIPDSLVSDGYFKIDTNQMNSSELRNSLYKQVDSLRQIGYIGSSIDSVVTKGDTTRIYGFLGPKYSIKSIQNINIPVAEFNSYFPSNRQYSFHALFSQKASLLNKYIKRGFINATVSQKVLDFNETSLTYGIKLNSGYQYRLDSVFIKGNVDIKDSYVLSLLNLKSGDILDEDFFIRAEERIANTAFMALQSPPAFVLKPNGKANVFFNLTEEKANEFDLLIGFAPNPNPLLSERKLLITGQGQLNLFNPFGTGKQFLVDYRQQQPESPKLDVNLSFPQIFKQEFGLSGTFNLYKQDSAFIKLYGDLGLTYPLGGNKNLGLFYRRTSSYTQRIDTNYVKANFSLPPAVDYNQNDYLVDFDWRATNRLRNPSKGFYFKVIGGVGNRTITRNTSIINLVDSTFNFSALYDGINADKFSWTGHFLGQYYIPVTERHVFLLQNNSAIQQYARYFSNDLYRIGGINSIRGFEENSFLASSYVINTGEYHFLLNRESYFSIFSDWALIEDKRADFKNQNALGIGTGLNLSTKAGIFSLNLAVGKTIESSLDFNKSRIHIGYINVF